MSSYLKQFNYQFFGPENGAKWVFLHGLMGYGLNWRKIASALGITEHVLIFDQRGHGKSIKPETGYAPEDYADDLYLILQELAWQRVTLVGHSMGGRNALMFAAKFPELLERLIIVDIGPDSRPEAPKYYQGLLDLVPTPFATKQEAKAFFLNEFPARAKGFSQPHTLGAYLYSNIEEKPDGKADWRFSPKAMIASVVQGRAQDHWRELRALPVPTLVIRGETSEDLTPQEFRKMQLANPRITGVEIKGAGHWVHFDQPQAFLEAVRKFAGI